jgi:periplasmic mercuric ion binding protein
MNRFVWLNSLVALPFTLFAGALQTVTLDVKNMTCAVCPITVKKALEKVTGVTSATVGFDKKTPTSPLIPIKPIPLHWLKQLWTQATLPACTTESCISDVLLNPCWCALFAASLSARRCRRTLASFSTNALTARRCCAPSQETAASFVLTVQ